MSRIKSSVWTTFTCLEIELYFDMLANKSTEHGNREFIGSFDQLEQAIYRVRYRLTALSRYTNHDTFIRSWSVVMRKRKIGGVFHYPYLQSFLLASWSVSALSF